MTVSAEREFRNIVAIFAGPGETVRAQALLGRSQVVGDNPSIRVRNLIERAGVTAGDKLIFGTADRMGIPLATTDRRFVLEAQRQGVWINHDLWIPPLQFTGV